MTESQYQAKLIRKLERMFPGCMILKNNPNHLQGVPDIVILYYGTWGALEVKLSLDSKVQPNQAYYVGRMSELSFASFICPETEKEVLNELQLTLTSGRQACIPQPQ